MPDPRQAMEQLQSMRQEHLLNFLPSLSNNQKNRLFKQILQIDPATFGAQQNLLAKQQDSLCDPQPIETYGTSPSPSLAKRGVEELAQGKAGCLLAAGGQGTRLDYHKPKGMMPLDEKGTTLFQVFAENIGNISKKFGRLFPLAIMTSPQNDKTVREFFAKKNRFGLKKEQLFFFTQETLPFLDKQGNLFLTAPDHIAAGPCGNGDALFCFCRDGIAKTWEQMGLESIVFAQIDNPLSNPLDPELIGSLQEAGAEISLKAIYRIDPQEKVGIILREKNKIVIKEYTEIPPTEQTARNPGGSLKHPLANISHLCFRLDFIKKIGKSRLLPLHRNFKKAAYLSDRGKTVAPQQPNAWKFEYFIFDALPFSRKTCVLAGDREQCFAPLKEQSDLLKLQKILSKPIEY